MSSVDSLEHYFKARAEAVSTILEIMTAPEEVLEYAVHLCESKKPCQALMSGSNMDLSDKGEELTTLKRPKKIAAPALPKSLQRELNHLCESQGIIFITQGLRDHLSGIDIGITYADWGIAETGTIIMDSSNEDVRLASMISDIHIAMLPIHRIRESLFDLEKDLRVSMKDAPNYTAFITGASRTADIERVLTLGVHGPLELHIILLEGSGGKKP